MNKRQLDNDEDRKDEGDKSTSNVLAGSFSSDLITEEF